MNELGNTEIEESPSENVQKETIVNRELESSSALTFCENEENDTNAIKQPIDNTIVLPEKINNKKGKTKSGNMKFKPNLFETFTKLWVSVILIFAVIDLQLSYLLAYLGRDQIAESLSVAVVTEVIGVIAVYMVRAFFDTKSEKDMELKEKQLGLTSEQSESSTKEDEDNGVG